MNRNSPPYGSDEEFPSTPKKPICRIVLLNLLWITAVLQCAVSFLEMIHWFGIFYSVAMFFGSAVYLYRTVVKMRLDDKMA